MKTLLTLLFIFSISTFIVAQENGGPYNSDENTVLLMHFDGDATNSASFGNDGIIHGTGVSYETGIHGQAVRLDNSTSDKQSWIEVPFYDELNASEEFAVECWFKINSWGENTNGARILFKKEASNGTLQFETILYPETASGQVNLDCVDDETGKWDADVGIIDILELNKWYHLVMYYKHEYKHVYCLIRDKNFEEIFAGSGYSETPAITGDGKFMFGFGGWNESALDCCIDEVRISNIYRKYRDDVLKDVDINSFKDSVFIKLNDTWSVYQWPLWVNYPVNNETGNRDNANACGPTMLMRTIHYWEYPRFPLGVMEFEMFNANYYADFDNTEYKWDLIPKNFTSTVTEAEYAPAALFSAHVGTASMKFFDSMYAMPKFLQDNFLFSKKTRVLFEDEYGNEEWENIIKNELNHGRPVMVGGVEERSATGGGGHYYIINGYNAKNEFFTDFSFNDNYWKDLSEFDFGISQDIIIYMEPDWGNKKLELEQPKPEDLYHKGSELEIQWSSENISNLIIEYSSDAGRNWQTVADNVDANSGSYSLTIPDTISNDYRVRISDKDNLNVYRKSSGIHVYNQKEFTFEYPTQDTKLLKGTEQTIYWQSNGIKAVKLEYSTDNTNWYILSDSVNALSRHFSVPFSDIVAENIMLKATDLNESGSAYLSESFQLIAGPIWGGPYESDNKTVLLMHFENNISNSANTVLLPNETDPIGYYEANFENNLGMAFRNINGDIIGNAIIVKNSENINLGNDWTMEAWVNISSIMGERTAGSLIINKWDAFNIGAGWQHFGASVNFENGTDIGFYNPEEYELDKWYHVALISDAATEKIYFYVHNENLDIIYEKAKLFPEGSNGLVKNNRHLLTLGGLGNASNLELDGYLDEVRITKSSKLMDYIETVELPFYDDFEENISNDATFTKWSTQNIEGWQYWHMVDYQGVNGSQCMRFENNDTDQDDWLVTRAIDCSGMDQLKVNFDVLYNGTGVKPHLFYKSMNKDENSITGWVELNYSLGAEENGWYSINEITINTSVDIIYFAFQSNQKANQGIYFLLDNFSVTGTITSTHFKTLAENNFMCYPNPVTRESVISFQTAKSENINLTIFDIQGRKIYTLLDKRLNAGKHTLPLGNTIQSNGIYFCKLATSEGVSTLKLIVNK